jgi:hypothetical protein
MKNIKIPQAIGNSITRFAYLELIDDTLKLLSVNCLEMDGYAYDSDRVRFTYGGKKCLLYGIGNINTDTGDFNIQVIATNDGVRDIWELPVNVKDFRFKTLDRIAYEVYDYCKGENDDDYEEARKEYIADGMDRYREFMS